MRLPNQCLSNHGVLVTAQLRVCLGLAEALNTLSTFVTAHTLFTKYKIYLHTVEDSLAPLVAVIFSSKEHHISQSIMA
jgi:hypothetical protein